MIQHLRNLLHVTVSFKYGNVEIVFHLLESLVIVDSTKTIAVKVSKTYSDALEKAKARLYNVTAPMLLKGKYDLELYKLLQIRGAGLSNNRQAIIPKAIEHDLVCNHLHLDPIEKSSKDVVSRAFRNIHAALKIPNYSYISNRRKWIKKE